MIENLSISYRSLWKLLTVWIWKKKKLCEKNRTFLCIMVELKKIKMLRLIFYYVFVKNLIAISQILLRKCEMRRDYFLQVEVAL